jgi:hypothetical protein
MDNLMTLCLVTKIPMSFSHSWELSGTAFQALSPVNVSLSLSLEHSTLTLKVTNNKNVPSTHSRIHKCKAKVVAVFNEIRRLEDVWGWRYSSIHS